ncbi:PREDICTED: TBC1 domain family member 7-like [Branchiostoma belcheri]|uniref:TBC1 domain family member 7 n=1 Tax=Branchiostoma belcheri TaxID=7741 RepID=A0A6P4YYW1_BRABE|nr:PREDICTED: TBC1 domain family member 7-like [Branchiostoma belcheri]
MVDDPQRNFRSHYYEKVGFRGVEEKKSLEILLKEETIALNKLQTFVLRFPLPALFRPLVWKVLLGVLPVHKDAHEFVIKQKEEQYQDMKHALVVMRYINNSSSLPDIFLKMHQMEEGRLLLEEPEELLPADQTYVTIATRITEMMEDEVFTFFLCEEFHRRLQEPKFKESIPVMIKRLVQYLQTEDQTLYTHMLNTGILGALPCERWFGTCFAHILPEVCVQRIWDKVIAGSHRFLVFVALQLLVTFSRQLLKINNVEGMLQFFCNLPADNVDMLVTKATELWQKQGSP